MDGSVMSQAGVSVNARASRLVDQMLADSAALRIKATRGALDHLLVDAGTSVQGSIEAGLRIAEICMGGLGRTCLTLRNESAVWKWAVQVSSSDPVTACLASQYAGWNLSHGEDPEKYSVLGSGPGRAIARKEALFDELNYKDEAGRAILVLEAKAPPPDALVEKIAEDCRLTPKDLVFIHAATESLAGTVQVLSRVLEVALHKAHKLQFPVERIVDGVGAAPLAPAGGSFATAMARTNDAIIYGGHAHLFVTGPEDEARDLANRLPSSTSRDHGRSFGETFKAVNYDFYAIDPMLFSPAAVSITALATGRTFHAGAIEETRFNASFA